MNLGNTKKSCLFAENIFPCRKCRLSRFETVIRAGNKGGDALLSPSSELFINENRKPIEFERTMQIQSFKELIPSTYLIMNESFKIMIAGLLDFIPSHFPNLPSCQTQIRWLLIRNYHRTFFLIDATLRIWRKFKGKFNLFVSIRVFNHASTIFSLFASYTTYFSLETVASFFTDCPDKSNFIAATETLKGVFLEHFPSLSKQFRELDPNEDEFLALLGLAFWSVENVDLDDDLLLLAARYRTEIIAELTDLYRRSARDSESVASRIGLLLCLLQDLRRAEMSLKADSEVLRMLGAFDEDTVTYTLQV
ncbi:hypothetical protein PMAYCL1PPCAC_16692, partial [Pristionchus mayeri]